jgi:hypothetical protein
MGVRVKDKHIIVDRTPLNQRKGYRQPHSQPEALSNQAIAPLTIFPRDLRGPDDRSPKVL